MVRQKGSIVKAVEKPVEIVNNFLNISQHSSMQRGIMVNLWAKRRNYINFRKYND